MNLAPRTLLVCFVSVLFLISSCALDEKGEEGKLADNQFFARFSSDKFTWKAGSQVSVFDSSGNHYIFSVGETCATAVLDGPEDFAVSETCYAVNPYSQINSYQDSKITMQIAPVQIPGYEDVSVNYAVAQSSGENLVFYSVCGFLGFEIVDDNVFKVEFSPNGPDEYLAGTIQVYRSKIEAASYSLSEGSAKISCESQVPFDKGFYYVSVLPQTFAAGVTIRMIDADGASVKALTTRGFRLTKGQKLDTRLIDATEDSSDRILIASAQDLQAFLNSAESLPAQTQASLICDVDMEGFDLVPAKSYAGTFLGNGKSLLNWKTESPLFRTLASTAVVQDLHIGETSSLSVGCAGDAAFIALRNEGKISDCTSSGAIVSASDAFALAGDYHIGAFTAINAGLLAGCVNGGAVSIAPDNVAAKIHLGGVAGSVETSVSNCENSAPIVVKGNFGESAIGGVAGSLVNPVLTEVINYSTSSGEITVVNGYDSSDCAVSIGGLVGRVFSGRVMGSDSSNDKAVIKGALNVQCKSKAYVGGVVGSMGEALTPSSGLYAFARQSDINVTELGRGSRVGGVCGYRNSRQNDAHVNVQSGISVDCGTGKDVYVGQFYGEYYTSGPAYVIHSSTINSPDFRASGAAACGIAVGLLSNGALQLGKSGAEFKVRPNFFNDVYITAGMQDDALAALLVGESRGALEQVNVVVLDHTIPAWTPGCLDIHFINTGTGECSFIIMPDGTQMLVDAASADTSPEDTQIIGGEEVNVFIPRVPNDSKRPSEWINLYLARCMAWTGNDKLDYISISHFDGDHIGQRTSAGRVDGLGGSATVGGLDSGGYQRIGIAEILDGNKVSVLVDRAYPYYDYPVTANLASNGIRNYRNAAQYHVSNSGMRREAFAPGERNQFAMVYQPQSYTDFEIRNIASNGYIWSGSGTTISKTYPDNDDYVQGDGDSMPSENLNSTVFRLTYGKFNYYSGGDIECEENALYPWRNPEKPVADAVGAVEVMKANHHGSYGDNSQYFLDKLSPQVIVVNTWRSVQPRNCTYERFKSSGADIFTTNLDSDYAKKYSDDGASVKSTHGHYVVRVAPGGDTYSVYVLNDLDPSMGMKLQKFFGPYLCE